jgi:hypothetical protein
MSRVKIFTVSAKREILLMSLTLLIIGAGVAAAAGPWRLTTCCTFYLNRVDVFGLHVNYPNFERCQSKDLGIGAVTLFCASMLLVLLASLSECMGFPTAIPLVLCTISALASIGGAVLGYWVMFSDYCFGLSASISLGPIAAGVMVALTFMAMCTECMWAYRVPIITDGYTIQP